MALLSRAPRRGRYPPIIEEIADKEIDGSATFQRKFPFDSNIG